MSLRIVRQRATPETLAGYAEVSAAMKVESKLRTGVRQSRPSGSRFVEARLDEPYVLDSDAQEGPTAWAGRPDLNRWTLLCAFDKRERAGGAIVALQPVDHWFFPPAAGLAVLWDLRVDQRYRRRGIGRQLILAAARCAAQAGCRRLAIETQDVNVPACRLYASVGAFLGDIRPGAYAEYPDDVALLWYLELSDGRKG